MTEFLGHYPDVNVRLELTDRSVDLIEEGLDVAIRIGDLASSTVIATHVGAVRRLVVATPEYLLRRGEPVTPDDLVAHDAIAFAGLDGSERWRFRADKNPIEVAIRARLIVNTAEAAIDAALATFGITRVLSYRVADALADKSLVRLLRAYENDPVPVHVLYPQGRYLAPKLRTFLDLAVPQLRRCCERIAHVLGD